MQPFKLTPALKDYIWGGTKLKSGFGIETDLARVAEAWALSAHPHGGSTIATGPLAGGTLADFFRDHSALCGSGCAGLSKFPVLVKLIDAAGSLSIQVHPDDDYAMTHEGEAGKTEMWVILDHEPGAFLYLGFEQPVTREEFRRRIEENSLEEVLHRAPVKRGDVFFLAPGTIHAIGAGILLAEVQQNSDSTYRVYDFGRLGADGKPRPLHIDKALAVTHTGPATGDAPGARPPEAVPGGTLQTLAACPYFTTRRLELAGRFEEKLAGQSFVSLLCLEGAGRLEAGGDPLALSRGGSLFVPADLPGYSLTGTGSFLLVGYNGSSSL